MTPYRLLRAVLYSQHVASRMVETFACKDACTAACSLKMVASARYRTNSAEHVDGRLILSTMRDAVHSRSSKWLMAQVQQC